MIGLGVALILGGCLICVAAMIRLLVVTWSNEPDRLLYSRFVVPFWVGFGLMVSGFFPLFAGVVTR